MRGISFLLCGILISWLCVSGSCLADQGISVVEVHGLGECADCKDYNFEASQAFAGLYVTIDCKAKGGEFKTKGSAQLDAQGKFKATISKDVLKDGKLNEECYARLYSAASATPCSAQDEESYKIVVSAVGSDGKPSFTLDKKIKFSSALCTSAFLWKFFKHPPFPKFSFPPYYHHPIYKKPLPPYVPIYNPPSIPVYHKPLPPPYSPPIYSPPTYSPPTYSPPTYSPPTYSPPTYSPPTYSPPTYSPPTYSPPAYHKPLPPPYSPPTYSPPTYSPPVYHKPLPPPYSPPTYSPPTYSPPVYHKPLPPPYSPPTYSPPTYSPPTYSPPAYHKPLPPPYSPPTYSPPTYSPPTYSPPTYSPPTYSPPTYTPPVYTKPPFPFYKPPCPPLAPYFKFPTIPKLPPKDYYFHKGGIFPPTPPFGIPQP